MEMSGCPLVFYAGPLGNEQCTDHVDFLRRMLLQQPAHVSFFATTLHTIFTALFSAIAHITHFCSRHLPFIFC
jgi:hypothetical protein